MKTITCNIPDSLYDALQGRMKSDKSSCDHEISVALSQHLSKPLHTLFQVSTSAALVEGLYQGAVRVSRLLHHGDFGLEPSSALMGKWWFWTASATRYRRMAQCEQSKANG